MIFWGVLSIVLGGIFYLYGSSINNSIDSQMESILNNGVSNPGSTFESVGVFFLVLGFVLLIIGVIMAVNKKDEETTTSEAKPLACQKCGSIVLSKSKFCSHCGARLFQDAEHNTHMTNWVCECGKDNCPDAIFCTNCGKKRETTHPTIWFCPCGATNESNMKFCPKCGSSRAESAAATPWMCSNCGTENPAEYTFCMKCKKACRDHSEDLF